MRRFLLLIFLLFLNVVIYAFTQAELEALKNDNEWFIGKYTDDSETKADRGAIRDLLSLISTEVESKFTNIVTETDGSVKEYCSSAINTYSSTRLDGAERSIFEQDGRYIVYRYIRKADKERIFEGRARLVKDYSRRGREAESELRIGDALMNYYWSLVLLRTHPEWDRIEQRFEGHNETLITYLPARIRRIFGLLDLEITNKRYCENDQMTLVNLEAKFNSKSVRNLDIKYYLGTDWSMPFCISQGKAELEFYQPPEQVSETISINVMYNDFHKASHNSDLRNVMENVDIPVFPECRFDLRLNDSEVIELQEPEMLVQSTNESIASVYYQKSLNAVCEAISAKNTSEIQSMLTETGYEYYKKLIDYGNARVLGESAILSADKINDKVYIRGLPVQFDFPGSGRKFTEELVFVFNEEKKIERINFALSEEAIQDIVGKVVATEEDKCKMINFIEEYKTAYCTENIDFIEKVFDNNALIIVGQMLKNDETNIEGMYSKLGRKWRAVKYSKEEYVKNLKQLFAVNEYVNLHFEDNQITRINDPDSKVFGLQIHQYYYSQHYADEGYLFLMFDLSDTENPRIYVRTWQPEKNPDGSIYGLDDFYLPDN